ncbi:MAG: hypothetical protein KJ041_05730, partial [Gammaproteobacteria bacterium]|nr:hypothetical protein [Gammaproteobacteria bacterium]
MTKHPSKTITLSAATLLSAGFLLAGTAQAASYTIVSGTLSDVRIIGGRAVPNISDYIGFGGTLDATDPANWQLAVPGFSSWDWQNPTVAPVAGSGISVGINGSVNVTGGSVTGASLAMLPGEKMRYGTFQSCTNPAGGTTADPALLTIPCTISDLVAQNLVWTYDAGNNTLLHQYYGPDAAFGALDSNDPTRNAYCEPSGPNYGGVAGNGTSGSCRSYRVQINTANLLSVWSWQGIQANYAVQDNASLPWNFGAATMGTLPVAGAGGHSAVIWDLSGFTPGVGGTIIAHVTSMGISLTNQDRTAVAATYTMQV